MKKVVFTALLVALLSACNGWIVQPSSNPPTPFLPQTPTPFIATATVFIVEPTTIDTETTLPPIDFPSATTQATALPAENTPIVTWTSPPSGPSIIVNLLGCNTSIDIVHGMGEVTNAYLLVKNNGNTDLTNFQVTLIALDEGRTHPDKTINLASLPINYEVNLKLTVDSTYKQDTPIQIEISADGGFFQRAGANACRDIGLIGQNTDNLYTPMPSNP